MNVSHFFLLCLAGGFLLAAARAGNDSRVLMDEMTTAEVRDAIQSGKTTVLLFNASTEASGPHLVLGKHIFRARYLGGNQAPLKDLAPKLDARYRLQGVRVFFSSDAYAKSDQEITKYLDDHGFPPSRHGGIADTSELWAVGAKYVRLDKIAMGDPLERPYPAGLSLGPIGVEGDPRKSSLALGKMFMDWKVKNGVAEIRKLIHDAQPAE